MPRIFPFLDPPLKLLGLLELRSKLWNTIFPEEFIRGLSTDAPLAGIVVDSGALRNGLRPILTVGSDGVADRRIGLLPIRTVVSDRVRGFEILTLGGFFVVERRLGLGLSESRERRGRSS